MDGSNLECDLVKVFVKEENIENEALDQDPWVDDNGEINDTPQNKEVCNLVKREESENEMLDDFGNSFIAIENEIDKTERVYKKKLYVKMTTEEQLIEAVRNNAILYDTNNPNYLKTKLKEELWSRIALDLNIKDGNEAKNMWLKLRNCHRDALRRQNRYMKSGASAGPMKKWKFQKQMEYLEPFMYNRARDGNIDCSSIDENEDVQNPENVSVVSITDIIDQNINRVNEDLDTTDDPDYTNKYTSRSQSSPSSPPSKKTKKVKKDNYGNLIKQTLELQDQRVQTRQEIQENPPNDQLFYFFMTMYEITKTLPQASQINVRNGVYQLVAQVESEHFNISPSINVNSQYPVFQNNQSQHQ